MKKALFYLLLCVLLFVLVYTYNLYSLYKELNHFFDYTFNEELDRIKSMLEGSIASGGDPVEVLTLYIEKSRMLKGAEIEIGGRRFIIPGSDILPEFTEIKIPLSVTTVYLYFDFTIRDESIRHIKAIFASGILIIFMFLISFYLVLRMYYEKKIEAETERSLHVFAASVLHEIKNRLNSINMVAYLIKTDPKEIYFKELDYQIRELNKYVAEMSLLKSEVILNLNVVNVLDIVNKVLDEFREEELSGINLRLISHDKTVNCKVDVSKMEIVLRNLIKNAIDALFKVSGGDILVEVKKEKENIIIYVKDSAGILDPKADVFSPFKSSKSEGMGIGLFNVKRIVEAHGGYIKAFKENGYTVFKVVIPCA